MSRADIQKLFDYVVVTMKNIPDVSNIPEIIGPTVTPAYAAIVLMQSGLCIEPQIVKSSPQTSCSLVLVLSAPMSATSILYMTTTVNSTGALHNPALDKAHGHSKLDKFAATDNGAVEAQVVDDIVLYRWRKILWNGIFNPVCAITQLGDSGHAVRLARKKGVAIPILDNTYPFLKLVQARLPAA